MASDVSPSTTTDGGRALEVAERLRLMRDGLINNSGYLVSGAVGILLVPILYRGLGAELYGLWIAAQAVGGIATFLDIGLGWSVTREVAAAGGKPLPPAVVRLATTVGNTYLQLGVLGAALIAFLGIPIGMAMKLSVESGRISQNVFALAGVVFYSDCILGFGLGLLGGRRRFAAANLVSVAGTLARAVGLMALLRAEAGIVVLASWQAGTSALTAAAALWVVHRVEPAFNLVVAKPDWTLLKAHLPFSVTSQLARVAETLVWQAPPLLVGMTFGAASIAPYYVGQRFPFALSQICGRAAQVNFPLASAHERAQDTAAARETLEVGARWMAVWMLPACLLLWILAPDLLRTWVGETDPQAVWVLRLTAAAVLGEGVGASALHLLWGRGAARTILLVLASVAFINSALSLALLRWLGIVGAAIALLVALPIGSVAVLWFASRTCGTRLGRLLGATCMDLLTPGLACAAVALGVIRFAGMEGAEKLLVAVVAGTFAYAASLYLRGAREEERLLLRFALELPGRFARAAYVYAQRALRRTGPQGP